MKLISTSIWQFSTVKNKDHLHIQKQIEVYVFVIYFNSGSMKSSKGIKFYFLPVAP